VVKIIFHLEICNEKKADILCKNKNCDKIYCTKCYSFLHQNKDHKKETKSTLYLQICDKHNLKSISYCLKCEENQCKECFLNKLHDGHDYDKLDSEKFQKYNNNKLSIIKKKKWKMIK
jgi:hypothetical protein